jgi:hypothetical protein
MGYSSLYYQVPCLYSILYRCTSWFYLSFRRFYSFPRLPLSSCCPLVPPLVLLPSRSPSLPVVLVITLPFCLVRGGPSLRPLEKTPLRVPDLANSPATSPIRMLYLHFHCFPSRGPCLDICSSFWGLVIVGVVPPSSVNR